MSELSINPGIEIRDSERELDRFRRRLAILGFFVLAAFGLLLLRFFYLQVIQHSHYSTLAEANRISILPIAPHRGIIVDRNGIQLAHNYSAYTLEITPSKVQSLEGTIDSLAGIIDITPRDRRRFRKLLEESKSFESLPIRTRLSDVEVARFAANRYRVAHDGANHRREDRHGRGDSHPQSQICLGGGAAAVVGDRDPGDPVGHRHGRPRDRRVFALSDTRDRVGTTPDYVRGVGRAVERAFTRHVGQSGSQHEGAAQIDRSEHHHGDEREQERELNEGCSAIVATTNSRRARRDGGLPMAGAIRRIGVAR